MYSKEFAKISLKENIDFIIIGDKRALQIFHLKAPIFSLQKQKSLKFKLSKILPINHYSRKNLGYLIAMLRS